MNLLVLKEEKESLKGPGKANGSSLKALSSQKQTQEARDPDKIALAAELSDEQLAEAEENPNQLSSSAEDLEIMIAPGTDSYETEQAVNRINQLEQDSEQNNAQIGDLLIEVCCRGNLEQASSRDSTKNQSFRKIAAHPKLIVSKSRLHQCFSVAVQERLLRERGTDTTALSFSKKRALTLVKSLDAKIKMLPEISSKDVSVRNAEKKIREHLDSALSARDKHDRLLLTIQRSKPIGGALITAIRTLSDGGLQASDLESGQIEKIRAALGLHKNEAGKLIETIEAFISLIDPKSQVNTPEQKAE
jgi:hypothetical protein